MRERSELHDDSVVRFLEFREGRGAAGEVIGEFEVVEEIGRGGMGVVYSAIQPSLGRRVALKVLPRLPSDADEGAPARIEREARILAALQHPNIVRVLSAGDWDGQRFVAMELVNGMTLRRLIERGPDALDEIGHEVWLPYVLGVLHKVADALAAAHERGIVHRDVKPENILLDESGEPFLADFGLARESDPDVTRTQGFAGTPRYAAPEQIAGAAPSPAIDVFSLGATAFEALTRRHAFPGSGTAEVTEAVSFRDASWPHTPQIPRDVRAVIERSLEKRPAARYPTARELADELGRLIRFEPVHARPRSAASRVWNRARRRPLRASAYVALAGLAAALLAAAALLSSSRSDVRRLEGQDILDRANEALRRGDHETAGDLLAPLLSWDPPPPFTFALLGDVATLREEFDRALDLYQRAYAAGPTLANRAALSLLAEQSNGTPLPPAETLPPPQDFRDLYFLARYRDRSGDYAGALEAIDAALLSEPRNSALHLVRGRILRRMGRDRDALGAVERAHHLAPGSRAVAVEYLEVLLSNRMYARVEAAVPELAQGVGGADLHVYLSVAHRMEGRVDKAHEIAKEVHEEAPSPYSLTQLVLAKVGVRDFAGAHEALSNATDSLELSDVLYARAALARAEQDYTEAERIGKQMVELERPWWASRDGLRVLGGVYREQRRHEKALEVFEQLAMLNPEDPKWLMHLGNVYQDLGQPENARKCLARAQALEPQAYDTLRLQAELHRSLGEFEEALVLYERCIGLRPDMEPQLSFYIGRTWHDLDNPAAGLMYIDRALTTWPDWDWALINRAVCLKDLGRGAEAAAVYERVLSRSLSGVPAVHADYADALDLAGRERDALDAYAVAREMDTELPTAWCGAAVIHLWPDDEALRDVERGRELLERAIELAPDSQEYRELHARMVRDFGGPEGAPRR
ncbi:MAG: tetratricopeptide repeat protein [Planctomycetota bacterium]